MLVKVFNLLVQVLDLAVNVSQVPQRSPFRYPGGKTWLIPTLRRWLNNLPVAQRKHFIEPFAGGASASLLAVMENFSDTAFFAELDGEVARVWNNVLSANGCELAERVEGFKISKATANRLFAHAANGAELSEKALAVLVRNRIQRGGVLAPGAGRIKSGENEKGISSRWYPETISKRLTAIHAARERLSFTNEDGFELLKRFQSDSEAVAFIDPPYFTEAKRLYSHWQIEHRTLFAVLKEFRGDFLLTYDDAPLVRTWIEEFGYQAIAVKVKTTHHTKKRELLISRNLDWIHHPPAKSGQAKAAFVQVTRRVKTASGKLSAA